MENENSFENNNILNQNSNVDNNLGSERSLDEYSSESGFTLENEVSDYEEGETKVNFSMLKEIVLEQSEFLNRMPNITDYIFSLLEENFSTELDAFRFLDSARCVYGSYSDLVQTDDIRNIIKVWFDDLNAFFDIYNNIAETPLEIGSLQQLVWAAVDFASMEIAEQLKVHFAEEE